MHDLLTDPLISIRRAVGDSKVSLPELLATLARGEVLGYPRLRPHQMDPFHVVTVQLAASILARRTRGNPPTDPQFWRDGLLDLADGDASAWQLVVNDPTVPAFMQSPCASKADFKQYKPKATTPDELDILVTAKDHDVKSARLRAGDSELWLAALITSQTTCGYLGSGNYGIFRMNSGSGSRSIVSTVTDTRPAPRFREEVPIVLAIRQQSLAAPFGYRERGVVLTWLKPWDRSGSQYAFSELDPLFIEAARAVRLHAIDGAIEAVQATSKARQIGGLDNGDCGDPWTALNVADKKKETSALTVSARGFDPERVTHLLLEQGYRLTPLQRPRPGTGAVIFRASVLVRGDKKTEGFRQIDLHIPQRAQRTLIQPDTRDALATFAQSLLADAAAVQGKCLRGALMALVEGGPEEVNYQNDTIGTWAGRILQRFGDTWSHAYFPLLWEAAEPAADRQRLRGRWALQLCTDARALLRDAAESVPIPSGRRLRAEVRAEGLLESSFRKSGLLDLIKETSDVIPA